MKARMKALRGAAEERKAGLPRPGFWNEPLTKAKAAAIAADTKGSLRFVGQRHKVSHETVRAIRAGEHWATRSAKLPVAIKGHPGW